MKKIYLMNLIIILIPLYKLINIVHNKVNNIIKNFKINIYKIISFTRKIIKINLTKNCCQKHCFITYYLIHFI